MKLNKRLEALEQRRPTKKGTEALTDEELPAAIARFTPEEIRAAERELLLWLG
ncbi:hypothetical protein [Escherichia coli]|uniref:hypothetical protein n=1 Tax=Escherichia coli TaxID=562 RepID=UPI0024E1219B|nr:hypothetical protein [Escherichia coli]